MKPIWLLMTKWIEPPVRWPLQARKPEAFGNHALARKRRVAVNKQRHDRRAFARFAAVLILFGADLAEHDRIDDFEMRWVGGQRQVDVVAVERAVRRCAQVIFHVARTFDFVRLRRAAFEFLEDRAERLRHHVGEHVQAAAMRHAEHDFAHAELAAALDDLLERRDHRFAAIEAEALGAGVFHVAEFFEGFGFDQLAQDRLAAFGREGDVLLRAFNALLDPALLRGIRDVRELHADLAAIGAAQNGQDLAHGRRFEPEHAIDENRPVEIGVGEAVGFRHQFAMRLAI